MPETTWVLIADSTRARLFEHHRSRSSWELVFEDDRPELRDHELMRDSDRPGRTFQSASPTRHAMQPHTTPEQRNREHFARELVERLQSGVNQHRFGQLLLVAPPAMLGELRSHLDDGLRERVIAELDKDLTKISSHELPEHLKEWLSVAEPPRARDQIL
jgi:protein required for attachment to host cells